MKSKTKAKIFEKRSLFQNSTALVYGVMVLLFFVSELISPGFLKLQHMNAIMTQAGFLGIVGIGQTLIIMTGGIDLSVASVITLSNLVAAQIMSGENSNILPAVLSALFIGMAAGTVNGLCVYYLKIPAIIMTLATGSVVSG